MGGFLIFQEATPHRVSHHVLILRLSRCLGVCHRSLAAILFESTVILVMLEILHIVPAEEGPKELRQERCSHISALVLAMIGPGNLKSWERLRG